MLAKNALLLEEDMFFDGRVSVLRNQRGLYPIAFTLAHRLVTWLEHSVVYLTESIQQGGGMPVPAGSVAPSLLETGKAFTAKGMQVLELVGTESLSNHCALLFNRRKAKLSSEQKSSYDGKLKQVQQMFSLSTEVDVSGVELDKCKNVETGTEGINNFMMFCRFANALAGQTANDIIQRTAGRIKSLHSEGVHRISEMCCFTVSKLFMLGKSIIVITNKVQDEDEDADGDMLNIDWP
ncbi:hypothetical protein EZV62_011561 [Acer yangbiense]|uniref:DUF7798 domain-containing protein n=1 Tax=Acer yangbiense TaxID=1000413 RepID=A0A5C7I5P2_9ROSI|nr:hypothetical protein EZV62_011561 [Acer yangbiense]